ncbi:peptidoglycan D,D-transpeptidase FtsI family protein [Elusimicrobiota bacterium]
MKFRIITTAFFLILLYVFLGLRLYYVQISCHEKFESMAKNYYKIQVKKLSPYRGGIFDRNGIPLAINEHTYSIGFNGKFSDLNSDIRKDIKNTLGSRCIKSNMGREYGGFKWLARHVSPHTAEYLSKYNSKGLIFTQENSRFYPSSPLASSLIGCVGTDNQGLSGIEYNFDRQLRGAEKIQQFIRDARGQIIHVSSNDSDEKNGVSNIWLTIDINLQYILERELKNGQEKYMTGWGMAIVQDPDTGDILAMAEYPSFNNNSGVPKNVKDLRNRAVSYIFEPGSTFKIVTSAAALEENIIKKDDLIDCEGGEYEVGGFPIRDFEAYDSLTFEDCIVHSSNIGMSKIGERLQSRLLFKYARDFGFGNFTGIRLPGETRGILRKPDRWSGTSLTRISFGQEIGVTAVQLVGAFSTIANGGHLYEPRIVKQIEFNESKRQFEPLKIRRVISQRTAGALNNILKEVVKRGSGVQAKLKGYTVAGKTGTAQKYDPQTQTYKDKKYLALFGGYVPADNPALAIVVIFDEPNVETYWGGYVAAPVFAQIAAASLSYLNVPPSLQSDED